MKILARDAELKALKLQMNPHFLFNTLNSINALITQNPGLARKMISQLSELLRASLESHDKLMISLKEELDLVHLYIAIERIRFGEKMQFEERIDPELLTAPFPAMLLQPLLENAVKHGIANSRRGGRIELSIQKSNDYLLGTVSNEIDDRINRETSNGISLKNIQQRLDRMYGDKYTWSTSPNDSSYFTVSFKFPIG
ncbi:MAG: sensor histidine kinase [Candidatus Zhuqueibacterota bacterium]